MLGSDSLFFQVHIQMSDMSATFSSLLRAYQQVREGGEDTNLTVEVRGGIERVTLTCARTSGAPAACGEKDQESWRTPSSSDWRRPARSYQREWGMEGKGHLCREPLRVWLYPPTPTLGKRRSPSKFKKRHIERHWKKRILEGKVCKSACRKKLSKKLKKSLMNQWKWNQM